MNVLEVQNLGYKIENHSILQPLNLELNQGESLGIIGPNGAGKSTLLRLLSQNLTAHQGQIRLLGKELKPGANRQRARSVAVVHPREEIPPFSLNVLEYLRLGRAPFQNIWGQWSQQDQVALERAIAACKLETLLASQLNHLSSGEWQRVQLTRSLVQSPELLLLDEPTAHLDIAAQIEIFHLLTGLVDKGLSLIAVIHDVNLAAQFMQKVLILKKGKVIAQGKTEAVLTPETLESVYGLKWQLTPGPVGAKPMLIPHYVPHNET